MVGRLVGARCFEHRWPCDAAERLGDCAAAPAIACAGTARTGVSPLHATGEGHVGGACQSLQPETQGDPRLFVLLCTTHQARNRPEMAPRAGAPSMDISTSGERGPRSARSARQ